VPNSTRESGWVLQKQARIVDKHDLLFEFVCTLDRLLEFTRPNKSGKLDFRKLMVYWSKKHVNRHTEKIH
jgi:hypothetical protein